MPKNKDDLRLPPIKNDANKFTRGSLLVLAGSARFLGAGVLAAQAAARAGTGYVTLATPRSVAQVAQGHLLSVPVISAWEHEGAFAANAWEDIRQQTNHLDAVVIGPGITLTETSRAFVQSVLQQVTQPILVDADALNALAELCAEDTILPVPPAPTTPTTPATPATPAAHTVSISNTQQLILTPHAGELKRLFEATQTNSPAALAQKLDCIVVAKGPTTLIVSPTKNTESSSGTAALAKAGTGDVLSGIIGSLLAQGVEPFDACFIGVEIHGRAGRAAEKNLGRRSVCAEDLIQALPSVLKELDKPVH